MSIDTHPSLILRIRDLDDTEAWDRFFNLYSPLLKNFFVSRGLQATDADDIVQNVLKRVSKAAPEFEYDRKKGRFSSWLFRIARNELNRHFQKSKKSPQLKSQMDLLLGTDEDVLLEKWETDYRKHIFLWACQQVKPTFSENSWTAFWKTAIEEKPAAEVAESLGIVAGAVYAAKSRVIAKLRDCIAEISGDQNFEGAFEG